MVEEGNDGVGLGGAGVDDDDFEIATRSWAPRLVLELSHKAISGLEIGSLHSQDALQPELHCWDVLLRISGLNSAGIMRLNIALILARWEASGPGQRG